VKQVLNKNDEEMTYKPKINKSSQNMKREGKIEEVLLIDAKRRQDKLKQKQDEKYKADGNTDEKTYQSLSKNSQKLVY